MNKVTVFAQHQKEFAGIIFFCVAQIHTFSLAPPDHFSAFLLAARPENLP